MRHSWPCFLDPCAMYFCSFAYDYYTSRHRRRFHWAKFWIFANMWYPLYPQKKIQIQMMTAFAVHGATSSSTRQSHVACLSLLCMGHMTFPTWLTPIRVHGLPTFLTVSPLLRVYLRLAMLWTAWFRLMRIVITLMWPYRWLMRTWLFHFVH